MGSLWEESRSGGRFPTLEGDRKTEVLIIGGGMAGVLCGYLLHRAGVDYMLTESNTIGSGITANTTAKITAQHGLIYQKIIHRYGAAAAKQYLDANQRAVTQFKSLCREIDCDFSDQDAWVYSVSDWQKIQKEAQILQMLGVPARVAGELPIPRTVAGAVCFPNQAQFHPLKFIQAISQGLHIYEHTPVRELVGLTAITDHGTITAKKIIIATHFPFLNKHGLYPLKLYQHRSYVIALENAPDVGGMYVDEAKTGMSFRNYRDLLLLGGGSHRTGKQGGAWQELREFAKIHYPKAKERYHWATQDCMSLDGVPYIGPYSAGTQGLYVATGFNKWGMTTSMVAANLLTEMVQGRMPAEAQVFSPSRSILHPQLVLNGLETAVNLLTPKTPRCPHLGCALKWNKIEHSWDCSCHGSRFGEDGTLLNNPATGDLKRDQS